MSEVAASYEQAPALNSIPSTVKPTAPSLPVVSRSEQKSALAGATTNSAETGTTSAGLLAQLDNPNARTQSLGVTTLQAIGQQAASSYVAPASPAPTPIPAQLCDTTISNLYCVYTVQPGDSLGTIALKFGIKGNLTESVAPFELLVHSNKPDIVSEDDLLQIGQKLRIPTQNAVLHTILGAETLGDIADKYDVTSASILSVGVNGLSNADNLLIGQEILVANPKRFAKPAPPPPPAPAPVPAQRGGSGSAAAAVPSSISGGAKSSSGFIWPAGGPISSYFTAGHPLGIDIDFFRTPNQPVGAVKSGTVKFAGGNSCCSYGYYVLVDHGGGIQTLYAHLSRISVSAGQSVSQGQVVGLGGSTGYSTGNHLHFEVHVNGSVVNPMGYLP